MGIVVEFYSVDPDIVALAGSADSNPVRLGEALAAVRAAEPEMAGADDLENGAQAVQVGYLPPVARILAELSRHHGRLLTSVPVNSLVSEMLWTMLSSVGADLDLDQGVLQAVVLSDTPCTRDRRASNRRLGGAPRHERNSRRGHRGSFRRKLGHA